MSTGLSILCFSYLGLEIFGFPGDKDKRYDLYNSSYLLYHKDLEKYKEMNRDYFVIDPKILAYYKEGGYFKEGPVLEENEKINVSNIKLDFYKSSDGSNPSSLNIIPTFFPKVFF